MTTPLRIVGVAIRLDNIFFGMPAPANYGDLLSSLHRLDVRHDTDISRTKFGFYTSSGQWVSPEEALPIAQAAGQIIEKQCSATKLFSEDMW